VIRLENVRKTYAGQAVLADVSLHVRAGELALVTGASGAGKTTLLRLLYLAERPDAGAVHVGGREVTRLRSSALPYLRRNIGVIHQDFKLLRKRTALENVRLALDLLGLPGPEALRRAGEALAEVGLAGRFAVLCERLSGGEQQRVALARALVGRPAVLLCDEPTGNLDHDSARDILELVARAHGAGATVLIATHDPSVIAFGAQHGARRIHLLDGRITGAGAVVSVDSLNLSGGGRPG
jgi:cell division transport system ATP-binding protein